MISASLACQSLALSSVSKRALSISSGISSDERASCVPQLSANSADEAADGDARAADELEDDEIEDEDELDADDGVGLF